jgi:polycystin 1L2
LQGSSFQGEFNTYEGGGYVYELRGKLDYLKGNLSLLRDMSWIDRQTRAVFAEFSVYNPNVNLIMVSTILVEFLESGSILTTARFDPMNLFDDIGSGALFKIALLAVCMMFIIVFMIIQINEAINKDFTEYIKDFWTFIEWSIIIWAWMSFVMFIVRLNAAFEVLDFFKATKGYDYKNLQAINSYNNELTHSLGLCVAFSTIKLLKLLRFNKNISFLGLTLKNCFGELISFSCIFFIIWFAFVQLMYFIYGTDIEEYSSISVSMTTSFEMLIGRISVGDIGRYKNKLIGPAIFSAYNIIMICFTVNIFVSIIVNSFEKVRIDDMENLDKTDFSRHAWKTVKKLLWKKFSLKNEVSYRDYKDYLSIFPSRIEKLINFTTKVKIKKMNQY